MQVMYVQVHCTKFFESFETWKKIQKIASAMSKTKEMHRNCFGR